MVKICTVNIERKRLLKQRRERTLQNTRGKGPAEEYFLTALKASCKSYKASKNSHKRKKDNNNDDVAKSDNNDDNPIISDKESPLESPAEDNIENDEVGENSKEEVPSPLIYGRKTDDPTKVKSSKRRRAVKVTPLESPMGNPQKDKDKDATGTPTYIHIRSY